MDLAIDGENSHVILTSLADGFEDMATELDATQALELSTLLLDASRRLFVHERERAYIPRHGPGECVVCDARRKS